MKNIILSLILSIFPIYSFVVWIIIFNNKLITSQDERITEYRKFMFNCEWNYTTLSVLNLVLLLFSIIFLFNYFKSISHTTKKIISIIYFMILSTTFLFNIWGML